MTPILHIQLLGGLRLTVDDAPVTTLDSPRLQALLAYLLLHRDAPHARAHLAFQLWPDTTEAQAQANLRTLLHRLRQALPHANRFLHVDAQTMQWRGDAPATLDVADFERALAHAAAAEQAGNQDAARAALRETVEQYGGDLLPALYDDWVLVERERLRQLFLAGLEKLVVLLEQANEYTAAIGYAQRLLRHDPLHEATYQHLMRLHALSGDRASAVRVYRTCATVLERELGVEPSPATHETYERLRHIEVQSSPPAGLPPSVAAGDRRDNLPIALTSFIGRARELGEAQRLLAKTRLLTLSGPGGCGKTRLALAVANELMADYPDGVWLVDLAPLADPALVPRAVATVLGVREQPQRSLTATLVDALQSRTLLLLLDNCEHLIDACAEFAQTLLSACPPLRILATSRERLAIAGEIAWLVPSLSLPDPDGRLRDGTDLAPVLLQSEAVQLFVERAAAALPTFRLTQQNAPDVAQICRRLDGIPLAIELAATRILVLSVEQLAARLDDCFRLLTAGSRTAMRRQQTLQATVDWSYDLLTKAEQMLFRRLAIFAGGWTLEAAEVICAREGISVGEVLELLAHLVDKSLVVVEPQLHGKVRYRLLETIRAYALERLEASGEEPVLRQRHATYYAALAAQAAPWLTHAERKPWLERLAVEHSNLLAALAWGCEQVAEDQLALQLTGDLTWLWYFQGTWSEGRRWLEKVLTCGAGEGAFDARANALDGAGMLAWLQGDYIHAHAWLEESEALWRRLNRPERLARTLSILGFPNLEEGNVVEARTRFEESIGLCHQVNDRWCLAMSLYGLCEATRHTGDNAAQAWAEASLAVWRELDDAWGITLPLAALSDLALQQGDYELASTYLQESLVLLQEVDELSMTAWALSHLGDIARHQEDYDRAEEYFTEALALFRKLGHQRGRATVLSSLGSVVCYRDDYTRAEALLHESLGLFRDLGHQRDIVLCLARLADIAFAQAQPMRAAKLYSAVEQLRANTDTPLSPSDRANLDRHVAMLRARLDPATFAATWEEGRAFTIEQAIVEAVATGA
ncbi:MAG TPA: tetratricopeptide repeat protein [Roseiflexaceae bacterium]|nr:tetratricopeptide repeat protein [Roseiflexaceae bacterium]